MARDYGAKDIEVLSGLDPVRKRPGMYTDTARPNHLVQEVVDNSVDEALAGHASEIHVTLHSDQSISIADNGRGMPVDIHPEEGVTGVELILTRLHAGGKFSNKNYEFSGGLHGVGVSVVNALSVQLEVTIQRGGKIYRMAFVDGHKEIDLNVIGKCAKKDTGTSIRFLPDAKYFDSAKVSLPRLTHLLKAKAILCPGLRIVFQNENNEEVQEWCYEDGLVDYVTEFAGDHQKLPLEPFSGRFQGGNEEAEWAVQWWIDAPEVLSESYVNLIPTAQGGTHVNGLRTGLLEALREFCDLRGLFPRGVKLTPDDIWAQCAHVLSVKMTEAY